ncbi:EamA family transporter [Sinomicrobium weinanense]|uniref:DMT family transporter n=1 Tax=Sinomicrobium weinanense TaxID=2842200 RepID=A0A926Q447_9FLAO|nr:DMT family transporter [Sinomicrobium weinanense]MBC9796691.1 DMT family transporter [Sinomicrobium weinanense]MBU3123034.1 DMT family transporter [Sinomicrobium weinanense]
MNNLKGVLLVAFGAASYGILATIVKLANNDGFGTAGLTFSQYLFGAVILSIGAVLVKRSGKTHQSGSPVSIYPRLRLFLFGTSLGLTSSFYYLSIQYVPVSVGIILLMQTIWMGVILEFFTARELVRKRKIAGALVAILGTLMAARVFETDINFSFKGILYGLLAAVSYTVAIYAANRVSLHLPNMIRSKYLVYGGFLAILIFWNIRIIEEFSWEALLKWGIVLGLFGTILPPVLFNKGIPEIGTGLASIIAALEIPVSVFSAYLLLSEHIGILQITGIVTILIAMILINYRRRKKADIPIH